MSKYEIALKVCTPHLHEITKDSYTFYVPFVPNIINSNLIESKIAPITFNADAQCIPLREKPCDAGIESKVAGITFAQIEVSPIKDVAIKNNKEIANSTIDTTMIVTVTQIGESPI